MKEMGGIGRWALILLLLGNVYGGFAQDANTARAQHIYELFVAGQGGQHPCGIEPGVAGETGYRHSSMILSGKQRKCLVNPYQKENGRPILPRELLSIIPMWNLNVIISAF